MTTFIRVHEKVYCGLMLWCRVSTSVVVLLLPRYIYLRILISNWLLTPNQLFYIGRYTVQRVHFFFK